jgi:hypothetical protein
MFLYAAAEGFIDGLVVGVIGVNPFCRDTYVGEYQQGQKVKFFAQFSDFLAFSRAKGERSVQKEGDVAAEQGRQFLQVRPAKVHFEVLV